MWQVLPVNVGVVYIWAQNWPQHLRGWTTLMREFSKLIKLFSLDITCTIKLKCNRPELETNAEKEAPVKGNRFRRLQMKWELLSTKDLTVDTPNFDGPQCEAMRARYLNVKLTYSHFNYDFCRRAASKSRIPRPVLSPVQPIQDTFGKRPMTATYRADSPTSPSCANQIEPTSNK